MQSGLSAEEKQQHLAEVHELKAEIASQAAATARLRHSLEQRSDIIERLTANDVHQQEKINLLKVSCLLLLMNVEFGGCSHEHQHDAMCLPCPAHNITYCTMSALLALASTTLCNTSCCAWKCL